MLPVSIFLCLLPNVTESIFLCLVPNVTRVYLSVSWVQWYPFLSTRHRKIQMGNIGHKKQNYRHGQHWTQDTKRQTRVTLLPVSIFLCLLFNVTRVYLSVSCVQCYPCLSLCVLCPMLHMSIFLCLVSNVTLFYLPVSYFQCYEHKTQKDRHG
jgi:hypothetical protein